jgi:hypothetical protein
MLYTLHCIHCIHCKVRLLPSTLPPGGIYSGFWILDSGFLIMDGPDLHRIPHVDCLACGSCRLPYTPRELPRFHGLEEALDL